MLSYLKECATKRGKFLNYDLNFAIICEYFVCGQPVVPPNKCDHFPTGSFGSKFDEAIAIDTEESSTIRVGVNSYIVASL